MRYRCTIRLSIEKVAVGHFRFKEPEDNLSPPLHCFSDKAVVDSILVSDVYIIHVVSVGVYYNGFYLGLDVVISGGTAAEEEVEIMVTAFFVLLASQAKAKR